MEYVSRSNQLAAMILNKQHCFLLTSLFLLFSSTALKADSELQQVWKPPGELIKVGHHRLHINCQGDKNNMPTVIIDSGLGGFSLEWQSLQTSLSKQYKICSYDRAGYGWSDPGPFPRTTKKIVTELKTLMQRANLTPPYILVGHSFGGYNMMYFSKVYPEEVVGLILIDSSHPDQANWFPSVFPDHPQSWRRARFISTPKLPTNYPYEYKNIAYHLMSAKKARNALRYESMNFEISGKQVLSLGQLTDIPLVVLTRGERAWPQTATGEQLETTWLRLQNQLARMSKKSSHVMANFSGHFIHLDQPSLIKQAIEGVIKQLPCRNLELKNIYVGVESQTELGEC